jgi:hypothetical protein
MTATTLSQTKAEIRESEELEEMIRGTAMSSLAALNHVTYFTNGSHSCSVCAFTCSDVEMLSLDSCCMQLFFMVLLWRYLIGMIKSMHTTSTASPWSPLDLLSSMIVLSSPTPSDKKALLAWLQG